MSTDKSTLNKHFKEHILVCLSSAPSNEKIIRSAGKMAKALNGNFTALYVVAPNNRLLKDDDYKRLQNNINLAENLGATVTTIYGDDVSFQIAEYARLSNVTKIVMGQSSATLKKLFKKQTLTERLISIVPNIEINIIPDNTNSLIKQKNQLFTKKNILSFCKDLAISLPILFFITLLCFLFSHQGFTESNIITIYMLAVLVISFFTNTTFCWILSSLLSVFLFSYLFVNPKYSLLAYEKGYFVTFSIMFVTSLIAGSITKKFKQQANDSSKSAYKTKILFDTNNLLQVAKDDIEIINITAEQLKKLLERSIVIFLSDYTPKIYSIKNNEELQFSDSEFEKVKWVFNNNKKIDQNTKKFKDLNFYYYPLSNSSFIYGVVAIQSKVTPISPIESSIISSIIGECALSLENYNHSKEKEKASLLAKQEQIRANFLRTISHDLRTPLTSISGNSFNLLNDNNNLDDHTKKQIYEDIYNDSIWLKNLVENILSVTKLEEGKMNLKFSDELLSDVISEAIKHTNQNNTHKIKIVSEDDMIFVKIDARLIIQVIINLVDNAIKYTAKGSEIIIESKKIDNKIMVSISDNGDGIPDNLKEKVFEMFFTGSNLIADSRRSSGLGLALCKTIINAHGEKIFIKDNLPHGSKFIFYLPLGGINIYE